jgi:hypothetical protein
MRRMNPDATGAVSRLMRGGIAALIGAVAMLGGLIAAPPAAATFHLIKVREVYPGAENDSYVELQMYASGQTFLSGHSLIEYDATGKLVRSSTFSSGVSNSANQSTVLVGDTGVQAKFGVAPDLVDPELSVPASGGAVCWNAGGTPADCIAWGNFSGGKAFETATHTTAGSPASPSGIPAGKAIQRTIAPGCPTLLEEGDDTNDSATDFSIVSPAPRPNSVPPSEHPCSAEGGGNGGPGSGPGSGQSAPRTFLRGKPAKRTTDRTPTFRFGSDQSQAHFECRLDGKPFRSCRSPFTTRRLSLGRHRFRVRAFLPGGGRDPTAASYGFRVVG